MKGRQEGDWGKEDTQVTIDGNEVSRDLKSPSRTLGPEWVLRLVFFLTTPGPKVDPPRYPSVYEAQKTDLQPLIETSNGVTRCVYSKRCT